MITRTYTPLQLLLLGHKLLKRVPSGQLTVAHTGTSRSGLSITFLLLGADESGQIQDLGNSQILNNQGINIYRFLSAKPNFDSNWAMQIDRRELTTVFCRLSGLPAPRLSPIESAQWEAVPYELTKDKIQYPFTVKELH